MTKLKIVYVKYKCGHTVPTELIVDKLAESIAHRAKTRCLKCFNTMCLIPDLSIEVGDRVWIDCRAFGFIWEPLVEAIVESIYNDRILVKLVNRNILIDDPSPHQLVDLKYISTSPS